MSVDFLVFRFLPRVSCNRKAQGQSCHSTGSACGLGPRHFQPVAFLPIGCDRRKTESCPWFSAAAQRSFRWARLIQASLQLLAIYVTCLSLKGKVFCRRMPHQQQIFVDRMDLYLLLHFKLYSLESPVKMQICFLGEAVC